MTGGEEEIMAAFDAAYNSEPDLIEMGKPERRKAAEKRYARNPNDGRSKRATGRTAQFNFKCKPDLKRQVVQASKTHKMTIAELAEQAFQAYLATLPAKKGS